MKLYYQHETGILATTPRGQASVAKLTVKRMADVEVEVVPVDAAGDFKDFAPGATGLLAVKAENDFTGSLKVLDAAWDGPLAQGGGYLFAFTAGSVGIDAVLGAEESGVFALEITVLSGGRRLVLPTVQLVIENNYYREDEPVPDDPLLPYPAAEDILTDAARDGRVYARKDGGWVEVVAPEVNITPPTLKQGAWRVRVDDLGTWTGEPTRFAFQWQWMGFGGSWRDIPGAVGREFVPPSDDWGDMRWVRVAVRVAGESLAWSFPAYSGQRKLEKPAFPVSQIWAFWPLATNEDITGNGHGLNASSVSFNSIPDLVPGGRGARFFGGRLWVTPPNATEWTISLWFRLRAWPVNVWWTPQAFLFNNQGKAKLGVYPDGSLGMSKNLGNETLSAAGLIALDTVYHAVVVGDITGTRVYLDGEEVLYRGASPGGGGALQLNALDDLFFGAYPPEDASMDGDMDEIGLWTRALSAAEVYALYCASDMGSGLAMGEP